MSERKARTQRGAIGALLGGLRTTHSAAQCALGGRGFILNQLLVGTYRLSPHDEEEIMARALWKGAISFGLVTIPVSLYPAKNARENLAFHMLHGSDLRRVHNRWVDEKGHEVRYEEIVKGYEYEKDSYVVMAEADLKAANVEA